MPDEPTSDRPRRRPLLLAMLAAAAILLALASGGLAGGGSSRSSDEGTGLTRSTPATGQQQPGDPTHRGRHCRHGQDRQAPQQSPSEDPPV